MLRILRKAKEKWRVMTSIAAVTGVSAVAASFILSDITMDVFAVHN